MPPDDHSQATGPGPQPVSFHRWWVWLWGAVAVALIVLVPFIPFKWWALLALIGFGTMEGIGLYVGGRYPPLTGVIRRYVPRWVAFSLIYGITGGAGATWFRAPHPLRLAALVGLLGWFTAHFDVAFDDQKMAEERAKYRRIGLRVPAHRAER
jgi:hypothetical protein